MHLISVAKWGYEPIYYQEFINIFIMQEYVIFIIYKNYNNIVKTCSFFMPLNYRPERGYGKDEPWMDEVERVIEKGWEAKETRLQISWN